MAKRFRLRISWVISSFRSCRSKSDAAAAAAESAVFRVSPANIPSPGKLGGRCHIPVVSSSQCRFGSVGSDRHHSDSYADVGASGLSETPPAYLWRKEERWHVVASVGSSSPRRKIDSDDGGRELFPPLPVRRRQRRTTGKTNKKKGRSKTRSRPRVSTSSADCSHWFSSEDEQEYLEDYDYDDEVDILVSSSRSTEQYFSSPELNPRLKPISESPGHHHKEAAAAAQTYSAHPQAALQSRARRKRVGSTFRGRALCPSPEEYSSLSSRGRTSSASSVLRRLVMTPLCGAADGKVRESFAVVKRSEDPYGDFRRSMMEMVVEKEMYEEGDLEQLLHYFLLLNSRHHHPAIVRAFSDVWAALFPAHGCTSAPATPSPADLIS